MCRPPSSSRTAEGSNDVALPPNPKLGALPPNPRDLSHSGQNELRRRLTPPPAIPAAESALGLRLRSALSSAQVPPEWITSTSPCNHLSANGDYPLNFVSHSRGSVHIVPAFGSPTLFSFGSDKAETVLEATRKPVRATVDPKTHKLEG